MVYFIGISGISGSGKSSAANYLKNELGSNAIIISEDDYYRDLSHIAEVQERLKSNFDVPEAIDHELLLQHMVDFIFKRTIDYPHYTFSSCQRISSEKKSAKPIVIIEGLFIFTHQKICDLLNLKIYIDCKPDIAIMRRVGRDLQERELAVAYTTRMYPKTIVHGNKIIKEVRSKADYSIDNTGPEISKLHNSLNLIVGNIRGFIEQKKFNLSEDNERLGTIYVISGPSGVGKSTIIQTLSDSPLGVSRIIPFTTRPMRKGEENGKNYHFTDIDHFNEMLKQNEFLVHIEFNSNLYGTTKLDVDNAILNGKDILIDANPEPALLIKKMYPGAQLIFILPTNYQEIHERLLSRGSLDELPYRLTQGHNMIHECEFYDYIVINEPEKLGNTIKDIEIIIQSNKLKMINHPLRLTQDKFSYHSLPARTKLPSLEKICTEKILSCSSLYSTKELSELKPDFLNFFKQLQWKNENKLLASSIDSKSSVTFTRKNV